MRCLLTCETTCDIVCNRVSSRAGRLISISLSDSVGAEDNQSGEMTFGVGLSDAVMMSDALFIEGANLIQLMLSDMIGVSDSSSTSSTFGRSASDTVVVTDSLASSSSFSRTLADSVSVTDAVAESAAFGRSSSDSVSVTDSIARTATFGRSASDSVSVTDSVSAVLAVTLGDSTTLIDPSGTDTVAKPAGVVDGTVLIACVGHNVGGLTPPTGFVKQGNSANFDSGFAGFNWETELFLKVVTNAGTEPASYDFSNGGYTDVWLVAVQHVDNMTPVPAGGNTSRPVAAGGTTGTTANGASCTVARAGSLLLRFEASDSENRATGPAGMTALPGSPIDTTFNADYDDGLPAGSTGDKDSTYTNTQTWATHMIVLQPLS